MTTPIQQHEFNSRWWGAPVGIVTDPAFFGFSAADQESALNAFEWVEFKSGDADPNLDYLSLRDRGFFHVDTQINYRLRLPCSKRPESLHSLVAEFADHVPFSVSMSEIASFENERFFKLPGATRSLVDQRYVTWSNEQIERTPTCCLRIRFEDKVQGWYLGDDSQGMGLHLTLAMLNNNAKISGLLLFLKAYEAFANRGHRLGWAAFSVQNTAVHNIYASIGARFLKPTNCWMWVKS